MRREKLKVIDLFCGAGGESQGIHWAMQDENIQLFAINHWERACETHAKNFPDDECICQDITTVIPTSLVKQNEEVELMWASPECTHFSTARGGKPMDDQSRCTPFDIIRWLTMIRVKRLIIENVPEFETWGPLDENCRPVASERGLYFTMFINDLRAMHYDVDWRVMNAADYGAPTTRRRFFLQAVKQGCGKKLIWPKASYACNPEPDMFGDSPKPWIPAKEVIDWSIPCELIENRKKPLAANTMKRIMNGIKKYWGEAAEPFLVRYNGGENRFHSIHDPVPTLDTSNRYGLVQPMFVEFKNNMDCSKVDKPLSTVCTSGAHHGLVQPLLVGYYGNGDCHPVSKPVPTITCKDRYGLLTPDNVRLGFRMLTPKELAKAQSFPDEYFFCGTKTETVKQIGNAVCPRMAEALVAGGRA